MDKYYSDFEEIIMLFQKIAQWFKGPKKEEQTTQHALDGSVRVAEERNPVLARQEPVPAPTPAAVEVKTVEPTPTPAPVVEPVAEVKLVEPTPVPVAEPVVEKKPVRARKPRAEKPQATEPTVKKSKSKKVVVEQPAAKITSKKASTEAVAKTKTKKIKQ